MLQTVTIDIINDKALNLLMDLERLQLIRLRRDFIEPIATKSTKRNYKGAMTKQPLHEIDNQLNELRSEWE